MMMGKGFDTHGPTGPAIVTADESVTRRTSCPPDLGERRAPSGRLDRRHDLPVPR